MAAFAGIQIDRLVLQPHGRDAAAQANAQSGRLNAFGAIMLAAALLVVCAIVLVIQRRKQRH